jgi:hypothetical protein
MDVDYYSTDLIDDYINDFYRKECRHKPSEEVGTSSFPRGLIFKGLMFKAVGYGCDGPIGPASEEFDFFKYSLLISTLDFYGLMNVELRLWNESETPMIRSLTLVGLMVLKSSII